MGGTWGFLFLCAYFITCKALVASMWRGRMKGAVAFCNKV